MPKPLPRRVSSDRPFRHQAGLGVFHRPRSLVELLPAAPESAGYRPDDSRLKETASVTQLLDQSLAKRVHFSNPTAV